MPAAHAIETASFGLAPAGGQARTALHEDVRPGGRVDDAVRVWNKTDQPVTLAVSVQGASLGADGKVSLGGTGGASPWVRVGMRSVTVQPRGSVDVPVVVETPRNMPAGTSTAAVVVEPSNASTSDSAVVQRLALMVYVQAPSGSPLRAALPWIVWVAVALLAVAVGLVVRRSLSR